MFVGNRTTRRADSIFFDITFFALWTEIVLVITLLASILLRNMTSRHTFSLTVHDISIFTFAITAIQSKRFFAFCATRRRALATLVKLGTIIEWALAIDKSIVSRTLAALVSVSSTIRASFSEITRAWERTAAFDTFTTNRMLTIGARVAFVAFPNLMFFAGRFDLNIRASEERSFWVPIMKIKDFVLRKNVFLVFQIDFELLKQNFMIFSSTSPTRTIREHIFQPICLQNISRLRRKSWRFWTDFDYFLIDFDVFDALASRSTSENVLYEIFLQPYPWGFCTRSATPH
jgi:hypothetical protein